MAYISLYRKYRSQSFDEISGQEHVTRTLGNAIASGRVGHAYLFCGPRGTGKTSIARLLAKCLNCIAAPTLTPCNVCASCAEINAGITGASFNVQEFDAASKRSIDDIRHLRETIGTGKWGPAEEQKGRKVVIIDEVHMLTTEAFNALLKTLEEPPEHVLFVLATTDAHKVPATIVSRCQRFDFRRASLAQLGERLRYVADGEGAPIEDAAVERIARAAGGSWRDALSLLEQVLAYGGERITALDVTAVLGTVEEEALADLAAATAAGDGAGVFLQLDRLIADGRDVRQLARDLTEFFRELLQVAVGAVPRSAAAPEQLRVAEAFGVGRLVAALEVLAGTEREFRESDQLRLILEVALVRVAHLEGSPIAAPAPVTDVARATPPSPSPAAATGRAPHTTNGVEVAPRSSEMVPTDGLPTAAPTFPTPVAPTSLPPIAPPPAVPPHPEPVGESAPGPPPVEEEAGDDGIPAEVDLGTIRQRWRVLVEELKRRRQMTTASLVSEAQPARLDGTTLILSFEFDTHAQLVSQAKHRAPLEEVVAELFGARLRVVGEAGAKLEPADGLGARPALRSQPETSPRPARADGNGAAAQDNSRLVHEVIELFDGKIIEDDPI